jgi:hypothetical protein
MFDARGGQRAAARARAEKTLERLLSRGLRSARGQGGGLLLDPYAANNAIKSRVGEPADDAWPDWQATTRRNAVSLPTARHLYRLDLRREWHAFAAAPGRPLIFRLPLPLRNTQRGPAEVRVLEPAEALIDRRDGPGRVELRLDPGRVSGPVMAEMAVQFVGGEDRGDEEPSAPLGAAVGPEDEPWLRENEGVIAPSGAVKALAAKLADGRGTARDLAHSAWEWLISNLRFGDVHRGDLDSQDPLGGLLRTRLADCALGSSLLVGICRTLGVPARVLSGFLLHPANIGPHSWAEVRLAPGRWVPFDFGSWCYCAGDPRDPVWGNFFRGRVDARFIAEVAPREFTGWGSASPPERWFRLERLRGDRIEHTLHALPDGALLRRDQLALELLGAGSADVASAG